MVKFYSRHSRTVSFKVVFLSILFSISVFSAKSQAGNALMYTGTGINPNTFPNQQYLQLSNGIVQSISGSFTIEAWVYWTSVSAWQRIFDFGTSTSNFMFLTPSTPGNQARFGIVAGSTEVIDAAIALPTNAWVHVAVSIDGTNTARIFFNGVLQGSGTITQRPSVLGNTTANYLGKSQFPDPTFNGVIEELRISNVARYTVNFTPQKTQFTTDGNTVALFHFNEGVGQTTADASANGFSGTLGFSVASEPDLDPTWITNSLLPVRMESFTAEKSGNTIDLKWKASATTDEGGEFVVERSVDGNRYESIGTIAIAKNTNSNSYSFKDANPVQSKNFYRLKIMEFNASPKYSSIVWIDMNSKGNYAVHPTITGGELFVSLPTETNVSIYNAGGVLVQRMQLQASQTINVSGLTKGLYHIQFEGTGKTGRFIKL